MGRRCPNENEVTAAMQRDPQVDLIFSHFIPRYEATGVDPNDLRALMPRVTQWQDWCRLWSELGARHEALGEEAKAQGCRRTAAEAWVRAAICYHYGKHLFADRPEEFRGAHDAMLRCYSAAAAHRPADRTRRVSLQGCGDAGMAAQTARRRAASRRDHPARARCLQGRAPCLGRKLCRSRRRRLDARWSRPGRDLVSSAGDA